MDILTYYRFCYFISMSSSEAHTSRDFHELRRTVRSTCIITEIMQQWAKLVLEWVTASVHYLCF